MPMLTVTGMRAPDAGRERHLLHVASQPLRDRRGELGIRLRHDQHELLAAIARDEVDAAHAAPQPVGEVPQDVVAGIVAVGVVDRP